MKNFLLGYRFPRNRHCSCAGLFVPVNTYSCCFSIFIVHQSRRDIYSRLTLSSNLDYERISTRLGFTEFPPYTNIIQRSRCDSRIEELVSRCFGKRTIQKRDRAQIRKTLLNDHSILRHANKFTARECVTRN